MTGSHYKRVEKLQREELDCWRVRGPRGELLITSQGAQILEYREHDEPPLIWLSEQARLQRGQSVRGGVPVCWPWFGDLARNPEAVRAHYQGKAPGDKGSAQGNADAPAHGLVRAIDWQLLDIAENDDAVRLSFGCATEALPGWPLAPELRLEVTLDECLRIALRNHNRTDQPIALSQALHSYFAVSDVRQVHVEGLQELDYIETLEDWQPRRQPTQPTFSGETDRIYLDVPPRLCIVDPGWRRRIELQTSGSRSAVLWNPWTEKARRLSQFADDAWQRMLCIETANVLGDILSLAPGEQHSLEVQLWSEPL